MIMSDMFIADIGDNEFSLWQEENDLGRKGLSYM